jgi:glycerol-3-phosphate O-acyltransferase
VLAPRNAQFGNACATFGLPLSLHDWQAARAVDSASEAATRQWVAELGDELMQRVARAIPVLPTHVLATIFATDPERAWPETNLRQRASELVAEFRDNGAVICLPGADEQSAFADTLRQFVQRKLVSRDPRARLSADPARIPLLRYLANSVEHLRPSA